MAIDTALKRRSVAHIGRFYSGAGVTMDATPDVFWRQEVGRSYAGISAGAPVIAAWVSRGPLARGRGRARGRHLWWLVVIGSGAWRWFGA